MAEDDEIDIVGDFSFNSCFAQNNQGIPSCSDREDTVHPQWLLDSTAANWYDSDRDNNIILTTWSQAEKEVFVKEIAKYGRNVQKISQSIKTKTAAEIQALIEVEYGVRLENPIFGLARHDDYEDIPIVAQEEVIEEAPSITTTINQVTTGSPTIKHPFKSKHKNSNRSLLKPNAVEKSSQIFQEDDIVSGTTETISSEVDTMSANLAKQHKERVKAVKKIGNHRRKVSRNFDKGRHRNSSKDLKSPQGRQRKDSSLSEDSTKSPKMAIVFSSGQALPVSEGEQVIKIEKKKDSDPESDIEIDIDSDNGDSDMNRKTPVKVNKLPVEKDEAPIAVPLRKFGPMPRRRKKINLDGGGGCTIMHTDSGDLYEMTAEPRKERQPRKQPVYLIRCNYYSIHKPAPFGVRLHVSTLLSMEWHAATSRGEVMGLVGGEVSADDVTITAYRPVTAAASGTHCDMDPVSQASAGARLRASNVQVTGWHHSHPAFAAAPSATDLSSQRELQAALAPAPCIAIITSQHKPTHHYTCFQVEAGDADEDLKGYQFKVQLRPDLTVDSLPDFFEELTTTLREDIDKNEYSVDMVKDVCPQANVTYLEKVPDKANFYLKSLYCFQPNVKRLIFELIVTNPELNQHVFILCCKNHMRSAGYQTDDRIVSLLEHAVRDIFR